MMIQNLKKSNFSIKNLIDIKLIPLLLTLVFSTNISFANKELDSLLLLVKKEKNDSIKCKKMVDWVEEIYDESVWIPLNSKVKLIAQKHLKKSPNNKCYLDYLATALNNEGYSFQNHGKHEEAIRSYQAAYEIQVKINEYTEQAVSLMNMAHSYNSIGKINETLKLLKRSIAISEKKQSFEDLAIAYNTLASVFEKVHRLKEARINFKKALNAALKDKNYNLAASISSNLSRCYLRTEDIQKAEKHIDKAEYYLSKTDIKFPLANILLTKSEIEELKHNYTKQLEIDLRILELAKTIDDERYLMNAYIYLGDCYLFLKKPDLAFENHLKGYEIAQKTENTQGLTITSLVLYKYYKTKKNYQKALEMYTIHKENEQKVLNNQNKEKALESKYEIEFQSKEIQIKKDKEISELKYQKEKQAKKNFIYLTIFIAVILFGFIFLASYIQKIAKERKLANIILQNKNSEIQEKSELLNQQSKQIAKYQSQMNPHFIFNGLNSIQGLVMENDKEKTVNQLQRLSKLMRQTLNNSENDLITLKTELEYLKLYFNFEQMRFSKKIEFNIHADVDIEDVELPPMLIQPLLENALKHAGLDNVDQPKIEIRINEKSNLLKIVVLDNGLGSTKKTDDVLAVSHAMSIIKSRIKLLFETEKLAFQENYFEFRSQPEVETGIEMHINIPFITRF
jgi:tetratricopeptide (TPR) repeat protein/Ca2+/Na+ antiporter